MEDVHDSGFRLLFIYGSDMHPEQIKQRCPLAEPLFVARLPGHRLDFFGQISRWDSGEETVFASPGEDVWGVVYKLDFGSAEELDAWQDVRLDGTGKHFHFPVTVQDAKGNAYPALTYKRSDSGTPMLPSKEYLDYLTGAASKRGLPIAYIEQLAARAAKKAAYPVPKSLRYTPVVLADPCAACEQAGQE